MGKLVSTSIPNLINGVSQQPDSIRLPTQAKEVVNCFPSVVEFLKRRQATRHRAKIKSGAVGPVAQHTIDRDVTERYSVLVADGDLTVTDLDGAHKTVNFPAGKAYLATATPNTDIAFLTINDYTFILHRKKVTAMLPDLTPTRTPEALVFIKQASYGTTYKVIINDTSFEYSTPVSTSDAVKSTAIAESLKTSVLASLGTDFEVTQAQSTLWIKRKDGGDFTVKTEDSRANTHMSCIKDRVQRFSDLPTVAPTGFVVEIAGDQTSSFDNYFVVFEPNNESATFDAGVWVETVKPGIPHKLDPATMPHALVREADGSFTFKPLDWTPRLCGDEKSAPEPSFLGRPISGIFFYRNRLAFLSGENVIMSTVGEFFTFWVSTVTTMVDSDPVDVAASHTKVASLEHGVPFSGGLLLFSSTTQFSFEHDDVLSNTTASVKPVTEFAASMKAAPVSAGRTVFFATDKGRFGGVREYFTMTDTDSNDAADVTAHVPQYIAGGIYRMVCSSNEDVLFILSEQAPKNVYVYKYFWNGSDKLQSSWTRWEFAGNVRAVSILNTEVLLMIQYPDGLYLERLDLEPGYRDADAPFEYKLDRKITEEDVTISYDPMLRETHLTLPYPVYADMQPVVVSRHGGSTPPGLIFDLIDEDRSAGMNTLRVRNVDLTGLKFFVGIRYTSRYVFSKQVLRETSGQGGQTAILEGRLQLRSMNLNYHDTGYFEAHVTPLYRPTSVYTFTGRMVGHGSSVLGATALYTGTLKFPLLSKNDQVDIEVRSDSPLPFNLVSADWEGFFNMRSSRV